MRKTAIIVGIALLISLVSNLSVLASDDTEPGEGSGSLRLPEDGNQDGEEGQSLGDGAASDSQGPPYPRENRERIADINRGRWIDGQAVMEEAASSGRPVDLGSLRATAGFELRIYLDADMFEDEDGNPLGGRDEGVSLTELRRGRVSLSTQKLQASRLIEDISLQYDRSRQTSYIKIEFVNSLTGTRRRTVAGIVRLRVGGRVRPETEFHFEATMQNSEIQIYEGTDYVYLTPGDYVTAQDNIRNVTIELEGGAKVRIDMTESTKYYGKLTVEETAAAANAQVVQSCQLIHSNLDKYGRAVIRFGMEEELFAYDANGAYLGTSHEDLPILRAYHFTRERVEELELETRGGQGGRSGADRSGAAPETGEKREEGESQSPTGQEGKIE